MASLSRARGVAPSPQVRPGQMIRRCDEPFPSQEFPWATLFAPTIVEGTQSYDGQLQMILTHDPTP